MTGDAATLYWRGNVRVLCDDLRALLTVDEQIQLSVQLVRAQGFSPVFGALEGILAPKVAEGYERRRRRTGVA